MTSKERSIIMGYFNNKKLSREELEKLLDFENLTMESNTASEISRLKELELEYSDFGIRVQRFSKPAYWEIFFNHFSMTDYEDSNVKLTFDQEYYEEIENEKAYEFLSDHDIDTDSEFGNVMSQIAEKWDGLSEDDKDNMISALDAIFATHYVDKSRVDILSNEVKKITMPNADLVLEVGLRDYSIEFTDGSYIELRF